MGADNQGRRMELACRVSGDELSLFPLLNTGFLGDEQVVTSTNPRQGINEERYWRRALSEAIDPAEIRDQRIIAEISRWRECPSHESLLIV